MRQNTIKFFEKLLRASSDGIVITDVAHNIIVVNEAFCNFFHREYCEVIETNLFFWLEHLGPNSLQQWIKMEHYIHLEGTYHDIEFMLAANDTTKYLSVKASLVEIVGTEETNVVMSIWREITSQKRVEEEIKMLNKHLEQRVREKTAALAKTNEELLRRIEEQKLTEKALRASENKYRMLLENLPQKIFYKDRNSVYISCNENLARDLHIRPDEITGKTDYDFFPKRLAEKYRADDKRIMESGKAEDIEEQYIGNGKELTIHTVKTPIRDEKGNTNGILGIFWDITEKISLEREAILNRQLAALGELAAGIAHEINNPITGIINCAQISLDKSTEDSSERDIARRIIKEGNRIANIVSKLLSFARPMNRNEERCPINICEIIFDTLILTETQLQKDGIEIQMRVPQRLPEIIAHQQQIQQVFLNIINNARYALNQKYPGVHDCKILEIFGDEVSINSCSYIKITFCDYGIGIPDVVKDKIMNPFFTTKPHGKGSGLGLSISHNIIQEHDGNIIIDSTEGEFTRVTILLPVQRKTLRI
ncbi:MAG: PAS domain S-box protein [wastewater metagenome]|nr:PAS domain S-box protein [Candidatus Loosdrechtia aerotolerans]